MAKKRRRKAPLAKAPPASQLPLGPPWYERLPWQIGVLAALALLAYANSLGGQFVYDDSVFLGDHAVNGPGFGREAFLLTQTRPLTFLTFHWNYLASGQNPMSWHAVNVLIHVANCVLLLLIARRHLSSGAAFIAAALYAVHPLNTEAVSYVYQRSTALATLFALLAFLLFLKEKYVWSAAAFGASLLCKEETLALPVLLLLYDLVYRRRRPRLSYYAALLGLAGLAVAHSFYVFRLPIGTPTIGFRTKGVPELSFILTEPRVVWTYLRLFLVPVGQNVDHDVVLSHGLLLPASTLPALLSLAALIGLLGYLAWRGSRLAFWGLGFFLLLAPTSSIVPVRDVMFEHRVYFPSICLVIVAAGLLVRLPRPALAPAVGAMLIVLMSLTMARNRVWHTAESLWTDAAQKSPRKARPYATLAGMWINRDPQRARQYLERAFTLKPDDPSIQTGLGLVALFTKNGPQALEHFQKAITLGGATSENLTNLAMAYHLLGNLDQAIDNYHRALEINPCMEKARRNLALALAMEGKKAEAEAARQMPPRCGSR